MTASSGPLTVVVAVVWFGVGVFSVLTALRHGAYVNSLPPTPGNRKIKRRNRAHLIVGVVMIAIGAWNTFAPWFVKGTIP